MTRPEPIDRGFRTLAWAITEIVRRCGGVVAAGDGLQLASVDHPCPILVNSALRTGAVSAATALQIINRFFEQRGHSYELWIRRGVDEDLEHEAIRAGMQVAAELVAMVIEAPPSPPPVAIDVVVRRVAVAADVRIFTEVAADGFREEAPGCDGLVRSVFANPASLLVSDTAAFVVEASGEPVATAMTMVHEGVGWLGWVATRPTARRRGFGTVAIAAVTREAFALGATMVSLEATALGVPAYRRLGFRDAGGYRTYWPGT